MTSKLEQLTKRIDRHEEVYAGIFSTLGRMEKRFDSMDQQFEDMMLATQQNFNQVDKKIESLKHEVYANGDAIARLTLKFDQESTANAIQHERFNEKFDHIDGRLDRIEDAVVSA